MSNEENFLDLVTFGDTYHDFWWEFKGYFIGLEGVCHFRRRFNRLNPISQNKLIDYLQFVRDVCQHDESGGSSPSPDTDDRMFTYLNKRKSQDGFVWVIEPEVITFECRGKAKLELAKNNSIPPHILFFALIAWMDSMQHLQRFQHWGFSQKKLVKKDE